MLGEERGVRIQLEGAGVEGLECSLILAPGAHPEWYGGVLDDLATLASPDSPPLGGEGLREALRQTRRVVGSPGRWGCVKPSNA